MKPNQATEPRQTGIGGNPSLEREVSAFSGWLMLAVNIGLLVLAIWMFISSIQTGAADNGQSVPVVKLLAGLVLFVVSLSPVINTGTLYQ